MNVLLTAVGIAVIIYLLPVIIIAVLLVLSLLLEPFKDINNIWCNLWKMTTNKINRKREDKDISNLEL
ncbi:MAG: hypothetical protein ACI4SM_00340 [Candidatus Gastranaerophilaceae bacterium]